MSKFPCRPLPEVRLVLDSVTFSQGKASPHWNMGTEQCWAWSQEPATQVQVLALTVLLGAQLSDSVSSCRVVWRQHVLLCPEYFEPGLEWEKDHAITGYQHKWGKQVSTHKEGGSQVILLRATAELSSCPCGITLQCYYLFSSFFALPVLLCPKGGTASHLIFCCLLYIEQWSLCTCKARQGRSHKVEKPSPPCR